MIYSGVYLQSVPAQLHAVNFGQYKHSFLFIWNFDTLTQRSGGLCEQVDDVKLAAMCQSADSHGDRRCTMSSMNLVSPAGPKSYRLMTLIGI